MAIFCGRCKREPVRDIVGDGPRRVQTPHTVTKRGIRGSICMQLDATARPPRLAQAKSSACSNFHIAETAYIGMARRFIASVVNERHLQPHCSVLPVAN